MWMSHHIYCIKAGLRRLRQTNTAKNRNEVAMRAWKKRGLLYQKINHRARFAQAAHGMQEAFLLT